MENPIRIKLSNVTANKRIFLILIISIFINSCSTQPDTTAVKGVLNLQNRSWKENGITDLNGEWEFYWNALYTPSSFDSIVALPAYISVPGFWNSAVPKLTIIKPAFGYATYRLKVLCPPTDDEKLELKFLSVASAYKLFVNGKQILERGKVGTSEKTTIPDFKPAIVAVTPENNELNIVVQVANFSYNTGGLWDFIKLGTQQQIDTFRIKDIAQDFFIAGSFFLIGIFYFVIYFFFRRRKSPLYFALFCLLIGLRSLVTGEAGINYITNWSWQFIKHIEYTAFYLTVPVLSLFSCSLFPKEFSKRILRYIVLISLPFIAIALFTSPLILRYTLRPFQLLVLLTASYGLYVYIQAVINKRIGSVYFLAGFIILFITIVNDILYTSLIIQSTSLLYVGLYILVFCQATALSRQFFETYNKTEKLNTQLEKVNNELNIKNNTINETNEQLSRLNTELDTLVFRTSHDLRSPITSVFAMADMIKMEGEAEKRNQYIDFQKKTLLRLDALITEILLYAKNKSTALHYEKIDLNNFAKETLQDHMFSANSEKIKRIVEVSQQGVFETDKARLGMVLTNLISNALKHHNTEGENPFLKIVVRATKESAEIEVKDNGKGIAPDHIDHIFNKFYTVNKKLSGSGFGLHIVKEAVEKLGGTIRVESQVNVGTTFFIVIPNGATS